MPHPAGTAKPLKAFQIFSWSSDEVSARSDILLAGPITTTVKLYLSRVFLQLGRPEVNLTLRRETEKYLQNLEPNQNKMSQARFDQSRGFRELNSRNYSLVSKTNLIFEIILKFKLYYAIWKRFLHLIKSSLSFKPGNEMPNSITPKCH
jgi:hypothetical protein